MVDRTALTADVGTHDVPGLTIVDLSLPIEKSPFDGTFRGVHRIEHARGGDEIWRRVFSPPNQSIFGRVRGLVRYLKERKRLNRACFPDGLFLSNEIYTISVHCGTHLDAPFHFGPLFQGSPAGFITDVPLEWCYGPGVVLDLSHKRARETIDAADLEEAARRIEYEPKPGDIVLIRTDADKLWPRPEYFTAHPGMGEEATDWLVGRGVKVIGTDTNGFDLPFGEMVRQYVATRDRRVLWPSHMYGRQRAYVHIERLANLRSLPRAYGFLVACFPIAIREAGAGWVRAVAIL